MCDCGTPLTDTQAEIGASDAIPFSLQYRHRQRSMWPFRANDRGWSLATASSLSSLWAKAQLMRIDQRTGGGLTILVFDKALYCSR